MVKRSQEESEQPAKVYQLDALDSKVDQANEKLNKLLEQMSNIVTPAQLKDSEKAVRGYIDEEIKKVHLEYGPMKRNLTWFIRASVGQGLAIVAQLVLALIYFFTNKS